MPIEDAQRRKTTLHWIYYKIAKKQKCSPHHRVHYKMSTFSGRASCQINSHLIQCHFFRVCGMFVSPRNYYSSMKTLYLIVSGVYCTEVISVTRWTGRRCVICWCSVAAAGTAGVTLWEWTTVRVHRDVTVFIFARRRLSAARVSAPLTGIEWWLLTACSRSRPTYIVPTRTVRLYRSIRSLSLPHPCYRQRHCSRSSSNCST